MEQSNSAYANLKSKLENPSRKMISWMDQKELLMQHSADRSSQIPTDGNSLLRMWEMLPREQKLVSSLVMLKYLRDNEPVEIDGWSETEPIELEQGFMVPSGGRINTAPTYEARIRAFDHIITAIEKGLNKESMTGDELTSIDIHVLPRLSSRELTHYGNSIAHALGSRTLGVLSEHYDTDFKRDNASYIPSRPNQIPYEEQEKLCSILWTLVQCRYLADASGKGNNTPSETENGHRFKGDISVALKSDDLEDQLSKYDPLKIQPVGSYEAGNVVESGVFGRGLATEVTHDRLKVFFPKHGEKTLAYKRE